MSICADRGWSESNQPSCAACMNPIRVRGESPEVARLVGEAIEGRARGRVWVAHFECRKAEWWLATLTQKWDVREAGRGVRLILLTDRPGWARHEPRIRYRKAPGNPELSRVH